MGFRIKSLLDLPPEARARVQGQLNVDAAETPKKPPKYGSVVTECDGITFDSKWEAHRYGELRLEEAAGLISDLKVHQSYALHVMTPTGEMVRIGAIEIDFSYRRGEKLVVEDTKSVATRRKDEYVWKRKHFEAEYGLKIIESERRPRR